MEQTVLPADVMAKSQQISAQADAAIKAADAARKHAMAELEPLVAALDPNTATNGAGLTSEQSAELEKIGMGNYAKVSAAAADLYAAPAVSAMIKQGQMNTAKQAYLSAKTAFMEAGGKSAPRSEYQELKHAKKDALSKLRTAQHEVTDAEGLAKRFPGSRIASTDLEKLFGKFGKDISKLKILKAAPLVDVAATGVAIQNDVHDKHWSIPHAVIADSVDTLAGVGGAAAVVAAAPEVAPVVLVAGAGAAVGYEGTEAVTPLPHDGHWGANIHKYGVVDGIGHSFEDAGTGFVHANVQTFDTVKNTAQKVWHGITSIF